MTSADPVAQIAALGLEPTYPPAKRPSLGGPIPGWTNVCVKTSSSRPTGPLSSRYVRPAATGGFALAMLEGIALSSYRNRLFSMDKLKSAFRELATAACRDAGE